MRTSWSMRGEYVKSCSCDAGCPCEFWSPPTRHWCRGMGCMRISEGHFGNTPLTGLKWAWLYDFPGPPHEGHGRILRIIDDRADPAQRAVLGEILAGRAGGDWFELMAATATDALPVQYSPIEFRADLTERTAHVLILGRLESITQPIRHPITRNPQRISIERPEGLEFRRATTATAKVLRALGGITFDLPGSHSSLTTVHWTDAGLLDE